VEGGVTRARTHKSAWTEDLKASALPEKRRSAAPRLGWPVVTYHRAEPSSRDDSPDSVMQFCVAACAVSGWDGLPARG
jgi:hypothetical protein